jgi:hypothetical protein
VADLTIARYNDPRSFSANFNYGRAVLSANRLVEARDSLTTALPLANTDEEKGKVYYWRAKTIDAIGNAPTAGLDWLELTRLPKDSVPVEWLGEARARLLALTPTPTLTVTTTPTSTPRPSSTARPAGGPASTGTLKTATPAPHGPTPTEDHS